MRRSVVPAGLIACLLGWSTTAVAPAGVHRHAARPDLTVTGGSVRATAGALTGAVVVRNAGRVTAKASSAVLDVRVSGKPRVLARLAVPTLRRSASATVEVTGRLPAGLPAGTRAIRACADGAGAIRERAEANNCRTVGTLTVTTAPSAPAATPVAPSPPSPAPPAPGPPPTSVPTAPLSYTPDTVFKRTSALTDYWVDVPSAYDSSHATPITLLVWLHGCGGDAAGDIYSVSPGGSQSYIAITVGGRDGGCWDVNADPPKVLAAIADVKTHFNIAPRRVVVGGYSSGGDLAYRTAFYNAAAFAGVLAENTSPFRDTGSSAAASLAAAAWKFHVVHLAHLQDTTYPIAGVRTETDAMQAAGFPITRVEVDGGHYDDAGAIENGHAVPGTTADVATHLLPHLNDGWLAPAG